MKGIKKMNKTYCNMSNDLTLTYKVARITK